MGVYVPPSIGGPITGATLGSVPYVSPANVFAQDNSGIFYDGTNHRLGLGTTGPSEILHISKLTGNFTTIRYDSGTTQGYFFSYDGDNTVNIGSNSNSSVNIKVNNSTKATFNSSGNLNLTGPTNNAGDVLTTNGTQTLTNKSIAETQLTLTDITTNDVSSSAHGFAPKLWASASASWSPSFSGWSSNPANGVYQYWQIGKIVILTIKQPTNGTSNNATTTLTLPVTAVTRTNASWSGAAQIVDNSAVPSSPGLLEIVSAGTTVALYKDFGGNALTASGGKRIAEGTIIYEAA